MRKYGMMAGLVLVSTILFAQVKDNSGDRATREADKLKKELSLNDTQYKSIKSINEEYADKWSKLRADSTLSKEARRSKMKTLFDEKDAAFKKVLSAEQQAKLKDYRKTQYAQARKRHGGHRKPHEDRVSRMQKELSLNEQQVAKIKEIDKDFGAKFRAIRSDSTLAKADAHEKFKTLHEEYRTKTKAVLTEEQSKKWDAQQGDRMKHKKGKKG